MKRYIDLRSDTVTMPTEAMKKAMMEAAVGDDVYEDDPTVIELEKLAADMVGKESALFVPSGTMANQIALMAFCKRGDEVILSKKSHIVAYEVGGAAVLAGVSYALVDNADEIITPQNIIDNIRPKEVHQPDTGLVCLENALGSGRVVPLEAMKAAYNEAKKQGLPVYLDGARLFNAAVSLGCEARDITQYADALMFCVSKGLAAPVGSLLCGDATFIHQARRYRKMLGGGMRQVGILAAAGIVALKEMTKRLHIDHENAKALAGSLDAIDGIAVDKTKLDINLIFFNIHKNGFDHSSFASKMLAAGIKINNGNKGAYRFATHNDINAQDIAFVAETIKNLIQ